MLSSFSNTAGRKAALTEVPYVQERFLIITADDFGASKNINEGIKIAADKKAITTISVLTNFTESLSELKEISDNHPDIGIGVHLNITTGKPVLEPKQIPSLVNDQGNFYSIEELLSKISRISADDLRKELRAQIITLTDNNIRLDHLTDQHGILSLYNLFFDIIAEFAKEYNVPVRTPLISSKKYRDAFGNSQMNKRGHMIALKMVFANPFKAIRLFKCTGINEMEKKVQNLDKLGILHPDIFIDNYWGDPTASNFLYILEHLPLGISEIVIHCGTNTRQESYPNGLDTNYFRNRESELITITSDYLKEYYNYFNIRLIGYSQISKVKI